MFCSINVFVKNIAILGAGNLGLHFRNTHFAHEHRSAAVVIENPTDQTIFYQLRWGNGAWESFTAEPHSSRNHWYKMNQDGTAPTPTITFDNAHQRDKLYSLEFYATHHPDQGKGKPYEFVYKHNGTRLDLVAK